MRGGLVAPERQDATPALGCARPAGRLAPHTATLVRMESRVEFHVARGNIADSPAAVVLTAARFGRCGPRSAANHRPTWSWGSRRLWLSRTARRRCAPQSSRSDYSG